MYYTSSYSSEYHGKYVLKDNKIIIMKYDLYGAGGYVSVSAYVEDLIYLSAMMENRLIYLEFGADTDIIGTENITNFLSKIFFIFISFSLKNILA